MITDTQYFDPQKNRALLVRETLKEVFASVQEKGYDPVAQFIGYIVSDDPTYITTYKNARTKLRNFSQDEILEELLNTFIDANGLRRN